MNADTLSLEELSAQAAEALAEEIFVIDIDVFEGPLHLLLELARRQKVDLLKVSILALAEQYLDFIQDARSKRIDLAADYLLMASWLAWLKSKLLLPRPEKPETDGLDSEDMAAQLAFRLKRLDAMRRAAKELQAGAILGQRVFLRGEPQQPRVVRHTEYDTTLWHLMQAFGTIRSRKAKAAPHRVEKQFVLPLESARDGLRMLTHELQAWASLESIGVRLGALDPDVPARSVTASVFTAALELTRDGEVDMRQDHHFAPLYLRGAQASELEAANDAA